MLYPIYRVHKEYHNSQYFFTRTAAEEFAKEKDAEWNICYVYDHAQAVRKVENNPEWQKGEQNGITWL